MYTARQKREFEHARKAANALGGEFFPFNQSIFLNNQMLGQDGVCSALTAVFMHRIKSGLGSFTTYVSSKEGREQVMALWAMQQRSNAAWMQQYLAEVGLKLRFQRTGEDLVSILSLVKIPGYYQIGISNLAGTFSNMTEVANTAISAHALCVINDGTQHFVFDPNVGAGLFTTADGASTMLGKIWRNMYKDMLKGTTMVSRYS